MLIQAIESQPRIYNSPNRIVRAYRTLKVVVSNRFSHIEVADQPSFDTQGAKFFNEIVPTANTYLEYGSGGSTLLAHHYVKTLVSVESDRHFLKAVARKLAVRKLGAYTTLIHANIGFTKEWGKPVFIKPSARRLRRWTEYAQAPWRYFRSRGIQPEIILVDGRFRVACVLESLLALRDSSTCRILVDDYASRPEYRAVEAVANLVDMKGRMAVFQKRPNMNRDRCQALLNRFYADFR